MPVENPTFTRDSLRQTPVGMVFAEAKVLIERFPTGWEIREAQNTVRMPVNVRTEHRRTIHNDSKVWSIQRVNTVDDTLIEKWHVDDSGEIEYVNYIMPGLEDEGHATPDLLRRSVEGAITQTNATYERRLLLPLTSDGGLYGIHAGGLVNPAGHVSISGILISEYMEDPEYNRPAFLRKLYSVTDLPYPRTPEDEIIRRAEAQSCAGFLQGLEFPSAA